MEGNSIRATVRMTGVAKNTVTKLLVELGKACEAYHDRAVRNLKCDYVECDEILSFVYAKEKNVPAPMRGQFGVGDVYTWTAINAESKLAISFLVGLRTPEFAQPFIQAGSGDAILISWCFLGGARSVASRAAVFIPRANVTQAAKPCAARLHGVSSKQ